MKPLKVVIASFVLVVGLWGMTISVDTLGQDEPGITTEVTREAVLLNGAGNTVKIADGKGTDQTVYKTTGYAVNLTGAADSYVQSESSYDISTDENWSVSVWGRADSEAASSNMTLVSLNARLLIWWNGSSGNWSAWYYDEGGRDSYRVNVSDNGEQPGNFTNIIVTANSSTLAIYRDNTLGETADLTSSSISDAPVNSTNWNGRIEELRTFDEHLDATNRSELVDTPVEQQPDLTVTARAMFDQPDKDTQLLLYTSTSLTTSNVTYSQGFAEQVMQGDTFANDVTLQTDYKWDVDGPRIQPVSGDELDGAPVAYASYDFDDTLSDFTGAWAAVVDLSSSLPVIAMAVAIIIIVSRMRG